MKNSDTALINKQQLGNRIRTGRIKLGLSLEKLGKRLEPPANKSIVSRWESGKSVPNNSRIKSLSKLLGIDSKRLLFGSEKEFILTVLRHSPNLYKELNSRTINSNNMVDIFVDFIMNDLKDNSTDVLGNSELVYQSLVTALGYFTKYPNNDNEYLNLVIEQLSRIKGQVKNDKPILLFNPEKGVRYNISESKKRKILQVLDNAINSLNNLTN